MSLPETCCCKFGFGWFDPIIHPGEVIAGHQPILTGRGYGNLSALDYDGRHLWTRYLGVEDTTGRVKRPIRIAFDSDHDIYVVWDVGASPDSGNGGCDTTTDGPAGGVIKFTDRGIKVWEYTLPTKHADYMKVGGVSQPNSLFGTGFSIAVASDDTVWVGAALDANEDWIHHIDTDGTLIASFGKSTLSGVDNLTDSNHACHKIMVDSNDDVWAIISPDVGPFKMEPDGTVLWDFNQDISGLFQIRPHNFALASDSGLLTIGDNEPDGGTSRARVERIDVSTGLVTWREGNPIDFTPYGTPEDHHNSTTGQHEGLEIQADAAHLFYTIEPWRHDQAYGSSGIRRHNYDTYSLNTDGTVRFPIFREQNFIHCRLLCYDSAGGAVFRVNEVASDDQDNAVNGYPLISDPSAETLETNLVSTPHFLKTGDRVEFLVSSISGMLPTPLTVDTIYYVLHPTTQTFRVAETEGGALIDLTNTDACRYKSRMVVAIERTDKDTGERLWQSNLGTLIPFSCSAIAAKQAP